MQRPTCKRMRIRSMADAHIICHGAISSGCIFVSEERSSRNTVGVDGSRPLRYINQLTFASLHQQLGIERWTDSIHWGPGRVREEFVFYHEKEP
ncbi:hypothetical protein B0H14DRAFT_2411558 [Mycena olivaceomarginata]|nr:hypothetical protein B0H14DRAFT_2411558 [Mycena olivaceomarginata]